MPFLMSPADALFLLAERPERPMHVGTLALLNPPEGTDGWDLREMVAAAQARERVAPLWRRRPHRSLSSLGQWYWRSDAEVDLGYHVRVSALPAPGGTDACPASRHRPTNPMTPLPDPWFPMPLNTL